MSDYPVPTRLEDVLITEKLSRRSPRQPHPQAENQALRSLVRQLAQAPDHMLQSLVDLAVELCSAGAVGVSLVESQANGEEIFRWVASAGSLANYKGQCIDRRLSPCAICLEQAAPVLFSYPERYFTHLQQISLPVVVEELVLPLIVDGQVLGTIWILTHDQQRQFDSEDVRLMTGLADFTASALRRSQQQASELQAVSRALEAESTERQQAEERALALIQNLPGGAVFLVDRNLRYLLAEGEALHIAGFEPKDLVGKTIFEALSSDIATYYEPMYRQALAGEPFEHEHQVQNRWYISRGTPLYDRDGKVYAVLAISYDITERKQAEAAIRESETKYRSLFESIDEGFCIIEVLYDEAGQPLDYRILEANPTFEKHTGLSNPAGKLASELRPGLEQFWNNFYARIVATGKSEQIEQHSPAFDRWFEVEASRIGDSSLRRVAVVFRDITEHKQAEATLRENEARQAYLLSMSDALRPLANPVEIQETATRIALDYFEADRCYYCEIEDGNAIIRRDAARNNLPSVAGVYPLQSFPILQAVIEAGRPFTVQDVRTTDTVDENLRQICLQLQVISYVDVPVIKNGKAVGILCLTQSTPRNWSNLEVELVVETADRTWAMVERARAEAALREREALYRTLFDSVDEGVCLLEPLPLRPDGLRDYRYLAMNPAMQAMFGIPDLTGQSIRDNFPDEGEDWYDDYDRVLETGQPIRFKREAESQGMVLEMFVTRIEGSSGQWLLAVMQDVTDRIRAEAERERLLQREQSAREEAERASRVKDEFLAILSHELRSPLNPILGWSKLLQTQKLDAAKTQQALSTIERNAKLQTQLIDDLLDINRILRGKLELKETTVNLANVISAAMEVIKTAAEVKAITLQLDYANVCQVRGDEGRLQQIIWNLLSNAIKFTPRGGRVRVRLAAVQNQACITITDTGKGISPDFLPYIFQSFRQEDVSITRHYGGLGLGLAIVKYLVDAHGGTITADSPGGGQGATFTVQLPLLSEKLQAPPSASASIEPDLAGVKILFVDDSEDTRELLSAFLTAYGAEISLATSSTEALDQLLTFTPDVFICDIGMPDIDGYTLLQQIRALPDDRARNMPAIAVTAFAHEEDRQRAFEAGFQQHFAKPIEPDVLTRAIAQLTT